MHKKPLKMAWDIYELLITDNLDHFSVSQLRELYMIKVSQVDSVKAQKIVYRQILRLYKLGMLSKIDSTLNRHHTYHKTPLFYEIGLVSKNKPRNEDDFFSSEVIQSNSSSQALLESRLKKHEKELITCIAESDEYLNLYNQLPELRDFLHANYVRTRQSSSMLSGQIKAIKSLIEYQNK